jgi:hypothetical protein
MMSVVPGWIKTLSQREREEFEAAKERGYLIDEARERENLWLTYVHWCTETMLPSVGILGDKLEVRLNALLYKSFSPYGREEMYKLFEKYDAEYEKLSFTWIASVRVVPEEYREPLAREIALTVRKPGVLHEILGFGPKCRYEQSPQGWLEDQKILIGCSDMDGSRQLCVPGSKD